MDIKFTGKYKSLEAFEWLNIPSFVVLTGPNGTGKSQLLELINKTIIEPFDNLSGVQQNKAPELKIIGKDVKPYELTYLKGEWQIDNTVEIDLSILQMNRNSLYESFKQGNFYGSGFSKMNSFFRDFIVKMHKGHNQISREEFFENLPELVVYEGQMSQKISEIFYDYKISEIELLAKGFSIKEIIEQIGEKPWSVLREIIKESKLQFEINDPEEKGLRDVFQLKLTKSGTKENIDFNDLSSGEKVLISLVFYLYNSQERKVFPKLLLLDEPDAHLHPAMSQQFINVIKNILVDKYAVQVIMTTHSPSTVVLSPAESIYIMSRDEPRINKAVSKDQAVSLLTSGLVYVGEGTKYILVEDNDDKEFYTYVYNQMVTDKIINGNIPLVFVPASTKESSGGKSVVSSWICKLQESGLFNVMHGLIDEDNGNPISDGVYKINRYSIENYLVDPLVVYAALIDREKNQEIDDLKFKVGEEYKLKFLSDTDMQKIADYIFRTVDSELESVFSDFKRDEETIRVEVEFANGSKLMYPKWLLNRKGKYILNNLYNRPFNSAVNYATTLKALKKLNIFPMELVRKFEEIKSNIIS